MEAVFNYSTPTNAHKVGVKAQILEQTLNSSGVREVARNLKIAKGTVIADLKKRTCASKSLFIGQKRGRPIKPTRSLVLLNDRMGRILVFCR